MIYHVFIVETLLFINDLKYILSDIVSRDLVMIFSLFPLFSLSSFQSLFSFVTIRKLSKVDHLIVVNHTVHLDNVPKERLPL